MIIAPVKPRQAVKMEISELVSIDMKPRTLIHGEPGVGKSTFAASAPGVVFLCVEQGTNNMKIRRLRVDNGTTKRDPTTYEEALALIDQLIVYVRSGATDVQNVAIDTVDALESLIHTHVCKTANKKGMASFTFGRGYDASVDHFKLFISRLRVLHELGVGIILLCHTKTEHYNNPEGADFDYYELKLHKKVAPLLVEWCDNVLFARREQYALEMEGGKVRGVGTASRFLNTSKTPAYVAKNRYDLPEKIAMRWFDYQLAMNKHEPASAGDLTKTATSLIEQMPADLQPAATQALKQIDPTDARTLAHFVDYCQSKLALEPETDTETDTETDNKEEA